MSGPALLRNFDAPAEFLAAYESEISRGGLWLAGATLPGPTVALALVRVTLAVPGVEAVTVDARVATVVANHGVGLVFEGVPAELAALAARLRGVQSASPAQSSSPAQSPSPQAPGAGNLAERLRRLSVPEKISLALAADREERFALLRDPNKTVHLYVLKNPRIGLDEVQYAIKSPSISPDALKFVSEHREWGNDPNVRLSLVRNPRTPTSIALRVLDLLPEREIRAFAKGNGRPEVVQAARRKVTQ